MYNVQFPKLGIEVTINRIVCSLFGFDIYWYGLLMAIGCIIMVAFALRLAKKEGINEDHYLDVMMGTAVGAIIGARAYYVAFAPFKYETLWDIINVRDGGLAIYGAVIGGLLGGAVVCKLRKIHFLDFADTILSSVLIAQSIGRWGNFMNQEAFGTNTDGLFGMISEGTIEYLTRVQTTLAAQGVIVDPYMPVHPTFLYESVWNIIGFIILQKLFKHRKFKGEMSCGYMIWYGFGRFFIEGLRTDSLEIVAGLRTSQLLSLILVVVGIIAIVYNRCDFKGYTKSKAQIDQMYDNRDRTRRL